MDNKIDLNKEYNKIISYLTKKECWNYGFIKYSQIKKTISYITKIKTVYIIRKLFLYLVEQDIFIKKQNKSLLSRLSSLCCLNYF